MDQRFVASFALGLAVAGAAAVALAQSSAEGSRPACVEVRGQARMQAYGFDHVVTIHNRCDRAIECRVSSDVDPSPVPVRVPAGESRDTLIRRGSPASAFSARADCQLAR